MDAMSYLNREDLLFAIVVIPLVVSLGSIVACIPFVLLALAAHLLGLLP